MALATVLAVGTAASGAGGKAAGPPGVLLTGVTARTGADLLSVLIEASEPTAYVATRPDPLTVLVDLRHTRADGAANRVTAGGTDGLLQRVTIEQATASDGADLARVRLALARPVAHAVRADRNVIRVEFATEESAGLSQLPPAAGLALGEPRRVIQSVSKSSEPGALNITLKGNGPLMPATSQVLKDLPPRLVLDFSDVDTKAPATTTVNQGPVQRVRVARNSANPLVTRVVLDLSRVTAYDLRPMPTGELVIRFPDGTPSTTPASAPPATAAPAPSAAAPAPTRPVGAPTPSAPMGAPKAVPAVADSAPRPAVTLPPAAPPSARPADPAPKPAATPPSPAAVPPVAARVEPPVPRQATPVTQSPTPIAQTGQPKQYTGHMVGFDFNGADLRAVIRAFAEVSGLNIVIDPAVKGSVDVALKDVPWDQAFDIILRSNKLGWTVDGTIVRIAPLSVLADEEKERRKLAEEQALSGELKVMTRALSYAKAEDIVDLVKNAALSNRASAAVDKRTNTIIITDLAPYLEKATSLLNSLDQPEMQVEIEARVIATNRKTARELGLSWGFLGQMTPELGNTTGLAFPNSVRGDAGVNLLTSSTSGGMAKLITGAINGAANLDIQLQALEADNKIKILLSPRVTTQNNVTAVITQGKEIPYQTLAAPPGSTMALTMVPTVQFKTAALKLQVTPHITPAGTVLMEVDVDNGSPGEKIPETGNFAINTERAQTTVIVKDGATTVIGGITRTSDARTEKSVPVLSRIPLINWLFRNRIDETVDDELLIFITPRIVKVQ